MRLSLMALCTAAMLFALSGVLAQAATPSAALSWTAPTTYTDGSPIISGELKTYTVEWRRSAGGALVGSLIVNAPAVTATVPVACGVYVFDVIATAVIASGATNPVSFDSGVACTPNPPTGLKVSKAS